MKYIPNTNEQYKFNEKGEVYSLKRNRFLKCSNESYSIIFNHGRRNIRKQALIEMYKEMQESISDGDKDISTSVKSQTIKKNIESKESTVDVEIKNPCPVCGEELTFEGGCNVCKNCGWSKCD